MSESPTEAFGPYLVYEQLGIGGMAQVHRAEIVGAEGFHRPVALKRMLPHVAADLDMVKSFVREAHLASHLHHANVAQTYELGKVDDIYFIAMELIRGRNLREILRQCATTTGLPMPVPVALNVINQICDALDYAHNLCDERGKPLGIIHRDVSPSNIIVAEGGVVKLIDFGIAKVSASGMQTMSGTIKGKFGYMAPEYLEGRIDARADLFALGVIAHELLTNRPLFSTPDDMETLKRVRSMVVEPPSKKNPNVPTEVDDIVMTALARDPAKRWHHATALRTAMTTITQRLGLVMGNPQAHAWIEWAFEQTKPRGVSAIRTIMISDEDPSIVVSEVPVSETSQITGVMDQPPLPVGTPQRITVQPGDKPEGNADEYARAVARYQRHDALPSTSGRISAPNLNSTLAGTGPSTFRKGPSASSPPATVPVRNGPPASIPPPVANPSPPDARPTAFERPRTGDSIRPPLAAVEPRVRNTPATAEPPIRASAPSLRDSAPTFDPPFVHAAKIEIPTTPMPVPPQPKGSLLLTVVLVLLVAGVAGTAVYFLLPLVT